MVFMIILGYLAFGFIGGGWMVAALQKETLGEYGSDLLLSFLLILMGPVGFVIGFLLSEFGKEGWSYKKRNTSTSYWG